MLALDITGIATNPQQAAALANTAARLLPSAAAQQAQSQYIDQSNNLHLQLKDLQSKRDALQAQIALKPANADLLEAQLTSVINQYSQVYTQIQTLGPATQSFAMSVLQPASPIQINSRGYSYRLNQNLNSRGQVRRHRPDHRSRLQRDRLRDARHHRQVHPHRARRGRRPGARHHHRVPGRGLGRPHPAPRPGRGAHRPAGARRDPAAQP